MKYLFLRMIQKGKKKVITKKIKKMSEGVKKTNEESAEDAEVHSKLGPMAKILKIWKLEATTFLYALLIAL